MPYIKDDDKVKWKRVIAELQHAFEVFAPDEVHAGDLNYLFSMVAKQYLVSKGLQYAHINDVLGALDGASKEFYRRLVAPYEDKKIKNNGDIYKERETE